MAQSSLTDSSDDRRRYQGRVLGQECRSRQGLQPRLSCIMERPARVCHRLALQHQPFLYRQHSEYQPKFPTTHADSIISDRLASKSLTTKRLVRLDSRHKLCAPTQTQPYGNSIPRRQIGCWSHRTANLRLFQGPVARLTFRSVRTSRSTRLRSIPLGALVSMIGMTSGWTQAFVQKINQTVLLTQRGCCRRGLRELWKRRR